MAKTKDRQYREAVEELEVPQPVARRAIQHIYFRRLPAVSPHSASVPARRKTVLCSYMGAFSPAAMKKMITTHTNVNELTNVTLSESSQVEKSPYT